MSFEKFQSSKVLSATTQKLYKSSLNRLASMGIDTKNKLLSEQDFVVDCLDMEFEGDSDQDRYKKRIFYSAIFWVLNDEPLPNKKAYYDAFQKAKQNYGK